MKIRMKTLMAGPTGTRHPGEIHDLQPKEAAMLVEGGYAEDLGEMPVKDKKSEKVGSPKSVADAADSIPSDTPK